VHEDTVSYAKEQDRMEPTNSKIYAETASPGPSFILRGLQYGFMAGLITSEIYLACYASFVHGMTLDAVAFVLYGHVFGVLPAVILGAISGLATSILLEPFKDSLRPLSAMTLGTLVAAAILIPFALVIGFNPMEMQLEDVATYLPIGLLYLISGAIGGWRLINDHLKGHGISSLMIALAVVGGVSMMTAILVISGS
jgi:hypothetical protein